jgi:flavin reductase (DIM6/NTAB) family NADH-FMN oxidoreductase RutF
MIDLDEFRSAMTRLPSAVTIVTTGEGDRRRGLTATAVCSLSADPPSILACVNSSAEAHDIIVEERRFAVNVLSPAQALLAEIFAGKGGLKGVVRFDHGEWVRGSTGAPVLLGASAVFDCSLVDRFDGFSHSVLVGRVEGLHIGAAETQSLLWYRRLFHVAAGTTPMASADFPGRSQALSEVLYGW